MQKETFTRLFVSALFIMVKKLGNKLTTKNDNKRMDRKCGLFI